MSVPDRETNPTLPGSKTFPGRMPSLAAPGVITPGQFGPTSLVSESDNAAFTAAMSCVGTPSVIATARSTGASSASKTASAANAGGTKITLASASSASAARSTVSYTGTPATVWPPRPGTAPATTFVP